VRDGHGRVVLSGRLKLFKLKKFTMPGKSFTIITSVFELEESRYVAENLPLAATPGHSALSGGPRESQLDFGLPLTATRPGLVLRSRLFALFKIGPFLSLLFFQFKTLANGAEW
jgi:hypothetical protein